MAILKSDSLYNSQLPALFPGETNPYTVQNIQNCISSFVKKLLDFNSPYDRFVFFKDSMALSVSQQRGMRLFFSKSLHCSSCHGGINFSTPALKDAKGNAAYYQNTGLYNTDGKGAYPASDQGLFELTRQAAEMGKYKVPTLRNLAFTAPYFHDGTASGLNEVLAVYEKRGRPIEQGLNGGDGRKNLFKNQLLQGQNSFTIDGLGVTAKGMYFFEMQTGNNITREKIMKQ